MVEVRNLSRVYGQGVHAETALSDVSCSFQHGEQCVLLGPSGSGKTTLLSILGCLLTPTSGTLVIDGQSLAKASPLHRQTVRRSKLGFVFQHAQLLPFLSVEENLRIVAHNAGLAHRDASDRLLALAECLDISHYLTRKPAQLSGGQRQRVAIARALIHRPSIVLADEPTAALDWDNGQNAIRLLTEQARADRALLIVVTHDTRLIPLFDRTLLMESGRLREE